jgi:hypothetical protein
MTAEPQRALSEDRFEQLIPAFGRAALVTVASFLVAALTGVLCNSWLSSEGLWHVKSAGGALLCAWLAGLGGTWHLHVTAGLPYGLSVQVLTGSAVVPWNTLTIELVVVAALSMRRWANAKPLSVAGATLVANLLLAGVVYGALSATGGVRLTARTLGVGRVIGLEQALKAVPSVSFEWAVTSLLVALAAGAGAAAGQARHRARSPGRQSEIVRVLVGALRALGVAAAATLVVMVVTAIVDPRFDHAIALRAGLLFLGGPAWVAQGLAMGTGAPMSVQATVLGLGASRRLGLLVHNSAAVWFSGAVLLSVLVAAMAAGRWYAGGVERNRRSRAAFIGVPFAIVVSLWVANSGLTANGKLGSAVATVAQVLAHGLLGMVPVAGSLFSKLFGRLFSEANRSGLTVVWGVGPAQALLGGLVIGCAGAWAGAATSTLPLASGRALLRRTSAGGSAGSPSSAATGVTATDPNATAPGPVVSVGAGDAPDAPAPLVEGGGGPSSSEDQDLDSQPRRGVCALCGAVETGGATHCDNCGARL